jgi:hypothetical protein
MYRTHPLAFGVLTVFALASSIMAQDPAPAVRSAIEVQTRGPVHEAYAQPFNSNVDPGAVIPREPPAPIPEIQPEQKPDTENSQWIPGYWSWDPVRQDFVWVSGVYRVAPQGRKYVAGYWAHTDEGWRWVPSYWTSDQKNLAYTPPPPASLDNGPSMPAPDSDSMYIPGSWVYRDERFAWRPGYYAAEQAGRVWTPPSYVWTPNGYAYVDGYWDYPMESRGTMFAPVYFANPLAPGQAYQPSYVVNAPSLLDSGFVLGNNFYFGNYYNPAYAGLGFRPWYAGNGRYDPLFSYYGWQNNRNNPNWLAGVQQTYANRAGGRVVNTAAPLANPTRIVAANRAAPALTTNAGTLRTVAPAARVVTPQVNNAAVIRYAPAPANVRVVQPNVHYHVAHTPAPARTPAPMRTPAPVHVTHAAPARGHRK